METLFKYSFIEARRRTERFSEMGFKPDHLTSVGRDNHLPEMQAGLRD